MTNLFQIVRELLSEHSMVIIPGLGGFVCNRVGARVDHKTSRFMPPSIELLFNQRLQHNDGLLVEAVARKNGISADEALSIVTESVKVINNSLQKEKRAELKGIGVLEKDGRNIILHADSTGPECVESFGLHDFYFPQIDEKELASRNIHRPVHTESTFSMSFAVIILFLLFVCQPISNDRSTAYQASMAMYIPDLANRSTNDIETINAFSVVLSKFSNMEDASKYISVYNDSLLSIDSLRLGSIGDEYIVELGTSVSWDSTISVLKSVRETVSSIEYPFVLCRDIEVSKTNLSE